MKKLFIAPTLVASLLLALAAPARTQEPATSVQPATGSDVLWRDPGDIAAKDTFWGDAAESRKPTGPFTFVREKKTGTTPKIVVHDASDREWDVKFGPEAHAEVAASRLVWALGYLTQEMYYLPAGVIQSAKDLDRADDFVKRNGQFTTAEFRLRDSAVSEEGAWSFAKNPFVGSRELSGLVLLMAMINNWDTAADKNKEIHLVSRPDGTRQRRYIVPDLGASFGQFRGPQGTPIKWFLTGFQAEPFNPQVQGDKLQFNFATFERSPTVSVPLDHARWFADMIGRLQEAQIRRAFEAADANPRELTGFTTKLLEKIGQLRAAVTGTR